MKFVTVVFVFCGYLIIGSTAENDILVKCTDGFQQFTECLKYKTIKFLDRLIVNEKPIPLVYSFYLTHNDDAANTTSTSRMNDENELSGDTKNIDDKLNQVLVRRIRMLASAKNLQIKFDEPQQFEGRRKDKNRNVMMMLGAGAMLLHGAMSKIAFIAGKALIVAKIALAISAVIALKKLFSHDDHHHDSTQVIYKQAEATGNSGGVWHRSFDNQDQAKAHQMAYSGQISH